MTQKEIQELIKYVSKSDVTEVEIEMKDFKIIIKSESKIAKADAEEKMVYFQQPPMQQMAQQVPTTMPQAVATQSLAAQPNLASVEENNYITVKSPMIGTFYRSSSPDKPVFIEVGDTINEGDTICIIEAMKLFNEIEAEIKGRIVKVLVDDASPVEYDQPLFLVDPS